MKHFLIKSFAIKLKKKIINVAVEFESATSRCDSLFRDFVFLFFYFVAFDFEKKKDEEEKRWHFVY